MKKKSYTMLGFLLAFVFAIALSYVFVGCKKHKHVFGEWQVTIEASCTQKGERQRVCSDCGEVEKEEIDMIAHNFGQWEIKQERDCENDEIKERVCSACSFVEQQTIPAYGHKEVVTQRVEPSCETTGMSEGITCSTCGKVLKERTLIPATGHNMTSYAPTDDFVVDECNGKHENHCQNPGCEYKTVQDCVYQNEVIKPTCTSDGYTIHSCPVCGYSFHHDFVDKLEHKWTGSVSQLGQKEGRWVHLIACAYDCGETKEFDCDFDEPVLTKGSCTLDEYNTYTCKDCSQYYIEIVKSAPGHTWDTTWTQTLDSKHERKCLNFGCEEIEIASCDHTITTTDATCTSQGEKRETCSVCGRDDLLETYEMIDHIYGNWIHIGDTKEESQHMHYCQVCEHQEIFDCADYWTEEVTDATCEASGQIITHCSVCQGAYTSEGATAIGHKYEEYEYLSNNRHIQRCKNPGCNSTLESDCQTTIKTIDPNCTTDGSKTTTCQLCNHEEVEVISKTGHVWERVNDNVDFNEWTITEDIHTRQCLVCSEIETGSHTFHESNLCDSCNYDGLTYIAYPDQKYSAVLGDDRVYNPKEGIVPKKIIIAENYQGYPVTEIKSGLDKYNSNHSCGFYSNKAVEIVILPKTLITIGSYAFVNCEKLREVSINGQTSALTTIGEWAFQYCTKLESITLLDGLISIGNHAFSDCKSLKNIFIPNSVTKIGSYAFDDTKFLNENTDSVVYINNHLILARPNAVVGEYEVLTGTLTISAEAFKNCGLLSSITLPDSLIQVDKDAFLNCVSLEKVVFKGTFTQWLNIKFENDGASPMSICNHLEIQGAKDIVSIPESVTSIPAGAFKGSEITKVILHSGITYIGEEAFENCASLETVECADGLKLEYVGLNAFAGTAFYDNDDNWTDGVLYVGKCLVKAREDVLQDYTIVEGTYSIAPGAFENNQTIRSVVIASTVEFIHQKAFSGASLEKARFENGQHWFAFMLQGAGRMPRTEVLEGKTGSVEYQEECQRNTAQYLTRMYTSYWRKSL